MNQTETSPPTRPDRISSRGELLAHLDKIGIATRSVDHPAVHTVAESSTVELGLPGAHTKNLFLKDEKGDLLLVIAKSSTKVDLKRVARHRHGSAVIRETGSDDGAPRGHAGLGYGLCGHQ